MKNANELELRSEKRKKIAGLAERDQRRGEPVHQQVCLMLNKNLLRLVEQELIVRNGISPGWNLGD